MDEILTRWAGFIVDGILDDIADGESDSVQKTRKRLEHMLEDMRRHNLPRAYRPNLTTKEGQ